jgi:transmembrane sensor
VKNDQPELDEDKTGFVHPDPVMDAALNWLFTLQAAPEDVALRSEFENWRAANPLHAETFATVADAWELPELDMVAARLATRVTPAAEQPGAVITLPARPKRTALSRVAMAIAATVLLAIGIQQAPNLMLQWQADYTTVAGHNQETTLPDGSRMVLGTASAVSVDFEGSRRNVTLLKGEAYFDVVHDAAHPFKVAANFSEVEVKGTAFSVRTDDAGDTVVLERGMVDVARLQDRSDVASLVPGESVTASATRLSPVRKTDTVTSLAWLEGRIVFRDQPFSQVLGEIARYYASSVIVANSGLDNMKVNGSYRLDDPERVIRSLATATGASVTRLPGGILILR